LCQDSIILWSDQIETDFLFVQIGETPSLGSPVGREENLPSATLLVHFDLGQMTQFSFRQKKGEELLPFFLFFGRLIHL